jgi:hypothetical protein
MPPPRQPSRSFNESPPPACRRQRTPGAPQEAGPLGRVIEAMREASTRPVPDSGRADECRLHELTHLAASRVCAAWDIARRSHRSRLGTYQGAPHRLVSPSRARNREGWSRPPRGRTEPPVITSPKQSPLGCWATLEPLHKSTTSSASLSQLNIQWFPHQASSARLDRGGLTAYAHRQDETNALGSSRSTSMIASTGRLAQPDAA